MQRLNPVIISLRRLRQKDSQFETSLGCTGMPIFKQTKGNGKDEHGKKGETKKKQIKNYWQLLFINGLAFSGKEAKAHTCFFHILTEICNVCAY